MRRYLRIPQLAAVMGPCIAGGAYLPALSDTIVMVEGQEPVAIQGALTYEDMKRVIDESIAKVR